MPSPNSVYLKERRVDGLHRRDSRIISPGRLAGLSALPLLDRGAWHQSLLSRFSQFECQVVYIGG